MALPPFALDAKRRGDSLDVLRQLLAIRASVVELLHFHHIATSNALCQFHVYGDVRP